MYKNMMPGKKKKKLSLVALRLVVIDLKNLYAMFDPI